MRESLLHSAVEFSDSGMSDFSAIYPHSGILPFLIIKLVDSP